METEIQYRLFRERFVGFLKQHKLRQTPERMTIIETLFAMQGHFTPEELMRRILANQNFRVSRATIYNNLNLMVNANMVVKHHISGRVQYERVEESTQHSHLICTSCGRIIEYRDDFFDKCVENIPPKQFVATGYTLNVYGLCKRCVAAQKRREKRLMNIKQA